MSDSWDVLVSRYLDGAASPEEVREIDARLQRDPEARRRFILAADQDATVGVLVSTLEQRDNMVCRVASRRRRPASGRRDAIRVWPWAAAAAALLIVASLFATSPSPKARVPEAPVVKADPVQPPPRKPEPPVAPTPREIVIPPMPARELPPPPPPISVPGPVAPSVSPEKEAPRKERKTVPAPAPTLVIPAVQVALLEGEVEGAATAPFEWKEGNTLAARSKPASVILENGTRLALAAGAEMRLAAVQPLTVGLEKGELYCSVVPAKGPALTVLTAAAEARVLGTHFSVALEGEATRIQVDEGTVRVSRRGDARFLSLRSGQLISIGPGLPFAAKLRPPNLLSDPGFEFGGRGWKGDQGKPPSFGPEIRLVTSPVHRGKVALQLSDGLKSLTQGVPAEPGATYEIEGWIKVPGPGTWGISIVWLDETGNWMAWAGADNLTRVEGPGPWTRCTGRFTAPPRTRTGWIVLYQAQPGPAVFDDFYFGQIPR